MADCDNRKGRSFGNPDYSSNHYYQWRGIKGFGQVVTPHELRYQYLWGNQLTSTRGDNYMESQLQVYIDRTIGMVEKDLGITIIATQFRHRPILMESERDDLPKEDDSETLKPFRWDDLYRYSSRDFKKFIYLQLRHKPVVKLQKWDLLDPSSGRSIINILKWAKLNYEKGYLQAYPRSDGTIQGYPVTIPGPGGSGAFIGSQTGLYPLLFDAYPAGFAIDYIAGYANAKDVPDDLMEIVGMLAAINLMADFGDGVVSGLASASVSLSGISESFGTTLSATSAFFGARIKDYTDRLGKWFQENRKKYRGIRMGVL